MRRRHDIPTDEARHLSSLDPDALRARLRALWDAGWSLAALGAALVPPSPKSTVHSWVRYEPPPEGDSDRPVPLPPGPVGAGLPTDSPTRVRTLSPLVPPDLAPRISALATLARRHRAGTPPDSPYRLANEELTTVARTLRSMGVPTAEIARAAGVSYRAMARRLAG